MTHGARYQLDWAQMSGESCQQAIQSFLIVKCVGARPKHPALEDGAYER